MKKFTSKNLTAVFFLILIVVAFPAASSAQGQSVFGPKDFRIEWMHFHLSIHSFNIEAQGEGLIIVSKKTPDKPMEGGFLLLNGQLIGLQDFLKGNNQSAEREASLQSRNFLTIFLRGAPGATISIEVKKGTATPPPQVDFQAAPQDITIGETIALQWTTTYADRITIDQGIGDVAASGSLSVSPKDTTTYTLTATGKGGTTTGSATVRVTVPTPTVSLTVNPETLVKGESATLTWTSTFADTVTIQPGNGTLPANGSLTVSPAQTTTYTITSTGRGGTANASATLTVLPPPEVQLSAEPQSILAGAPATLSWSSVHVDTAAIDPGIGSVPTNGTMQVYPSETTSYIITVSGPGGTAQSSATITVLHPPSVQISANPGTILKGEFLNLSWTSTHADSAVIEPGLGPVAASGSAALNPSETTTYTITVNGAGGSATASVTIHVEDPLAPPMVSITLDPSTIPKGGASTISWTSKNAQGAHIDNGIGMVSVEGALHVSPEYTTTYTITVIGSTGAAKAQATLMVTGNPEPQPEGSFGARYEDLIPPDATLERYDPRRFCLVTGLVQDVEGSPLEGVSITIVRHPEYGTAFTNREGRFSIPGEGGGTLTLAYGKGGFLTVHRKINAPWNDTVIAETIRMIAEDGSAKVVTFNGSPQAAITHRSAAVSDSFGTRSCTMVFKGDNKAYAVDEGGNDIGELNTITVRGTEFAALDSMPAILPPTSAYTYCAELQADGVQRARFKDPVIVWVNNFLGFNVGSVVPVGYYDRDRGVWVPAENGKVVRLLDADNDGITDSYDVDGDNLADGAVDGLTDATKYEPGGTFWRVPVSHFTPYDFNWPYGPPAESIAPNPSLSAVAIQKLEEQKECQAQVGSYIEERSGVFHEDIPIPGTGITLHYASSNASGYKPLISVPASGASVPDSLKRIIVKLSLAGRDFEKVLPPEPLQKAEFHWDRLDQLGMRVDAPIKARVRIGFVYEGFYLTSPVTPRAFAQAGVVISGIPTREDFIRWKEDSLLVQGRRAEKDSIAEGWTLSHHHSISAENSAMLYKGDGSLLQSNIQVIGTVAGNGETGTAAMAAQQQKPS